MTVTTDKENSYVSCRRWCVLTRVSTARPDGRCNMQRIIWWWWWTEPSTRWISDHSKLRLVGECDDVLIARSTTHKNVRRRSRGSWQRSSMSLSSAVPAWFPVSEHDLLQTAELRSCSSAIARRTDPVLGLRAREVRCRSTSSWPSVCPYTAFAVHHENV